MTVSPEKLSDDQLTALIAGMNESVRLLKIRYERSAIPEDATEYGEMLWQKQTTLLLATELRSLRQLSGMTEETSSALKDVASERQRQVEAEGWTPAHDDEHSQGELAAAAVCYAFTAVRSPHFLGHLWPWDGSWWKPKDKRRNLVKAGALILAEIERLDRLRAKDGAK